MEDNTIVLDKKEYNLVGPMDMHLDEDQAMYAIGSRIYVITLPAGFLLPYNNNNNYPYQ